MFTSEHLYQALFFVLALYPTYFLWRDISNDHDDQWISGGIIGAWVFDLVTYYILKRAQKWKYTIYYLEFGVYQITSEPCLPSL